MPEQTQPLHQVLVKTKFPMMSATFSVLSWRQATKQGLSTDLYCSTGLVTTVHCKVAVKPSQYVLTSQLDEDMKCNVLASCFSLHKQLLSTCSSLSSHSSPCLAMLSLAATKNLLTSNTTPAFGTAVPNSLQWWQLRNWHLH